MTGQLRDGFTTGTAAAAAAMAAFDLAVTGDLPQSVRTPLPSPAAGFLDINVSCGHHGGPCLASRELAREPLTHAAVIKDGGDDPDVTSGAAIYAYVFKRFAGGMASAGASEHFTLWGGPGVGVVTRPGLPVQVGEAAINPGPRRQIFSALEEMYSKFYLSGEYSIVIAVPQGRELALKTLNPRLGVVNGISILGTQGIVKPFSNEAFKATILQCVRQHMDGSPICFCTGRRTEKLLRALYADFDAASFIEAGDFVEFALQAASRFSHSPIIWGCFFGKALKLAQGLGNTHAGQAPIDLDLVAKICNLPTGRLPTTPNTARELLENLLHLRHGHQAIAKIVHAAKLNAQKFARRPVLLHLFHFDGRLLVKL